MLAAQGLQVSELKGCRVPIWVILGLYRVYVGIMENEMEATI